MKKIIAYCALHYGKNYLADSIRSVIDRVDEYHVLYTAKPSHGTPSNLPVPETKDELQPIALKAAGDKLHWHDGDWTREGQQRDSITTYAPDADIILNVDSDEIWTDKVWSLLDSEMDYKGAYIAIPFIHFYRSFYHAVLRDPAAPARILFPKNPNRDQWLLANLETPILHMGYAQPAELIRYKLSIHGHKNELRCSPDEYVDKIYKDENRWTDLHPIGSPFWNADQINAWDFLPAWMQAHPFAYKSVII